ncbi:MAG: antitoxin Xre/MbcA/ParS toxin-binding domain-containing protein [Gemmatimonadaceae bacterium]
MATRGFPATRYEPSPLVDLVSPSARERLSPAALKAFFTMIDRWSVRDDDARALLGGVTNGPYYEMKKHPSRRVLDADTLLRVSYLIGIFKALNILHGPALADDWVRLPNTNRIFGGSTPLAYMLKGGVNALQTVRRLLDARRGGM